MSLAVKTLAAVKSNYAGTVVRVGAQFVAQLVIMRALGPDLVGTFGYTLLLYGVMALAIDQGFGWALIQGRFEAREIEVVLARLMLASVLGMLLVFGLSYPIEAYLHSPLAGMLFRYSAPSYLLIAVHGIAHAKLRAELRFREIQYATTGAYLVAYPLVGAGMALAGCGVWSLLAAWYVQAILQFGIGYYCAPHSLRMAWPWRGTQAGPLGRQVAGINVLNWAVDNSSGIFAGALGPVALGSFNAASMLSRTPAMQVAQNLQSVLFSTASAHGADAARTKRLYLAAVAAVALPVVPAYAYALTHAALLIGLLFGQQWLAAAPVFAAMAPGMMALAISTLSGAILTATGGQRTVLHSQLLCLAMMLGGLYCAAGADLLYVGVVISVSYLVRLAWQLATLGRRCGVAPAELVAVLRGPLAAGAVLALQLAPWYPAGAQPLWWELGCWPVKLALLALACRRWPRFFVSAPLADVLQRFGPGRRLLALLGLAQPGPL